MMRTHQYAQKHQVSQSTYTPISQPYIRPPSVPPPLIQSKSNAEGLAEWEVQRQKWARLGTPWMNKVPHLSGKTVQPWMERNQTIGTTGIPCEHKAEAIASVPNMSAARRLNQSKHPKKGMPSEGNIEMLQVRKINAQGGKPIVQRNETSKKRMAQLAIPKFGQLKGNKTRDICKKLEDHMQKWEDRLRGEYQKSVHAITDYTKPVPKCPVFTTPVLGKVIIPPVNDFSSSDELCKASKFEFAENKNVGPSAFDLVQKLGLGKELIKNTVATMSAASQLLYLSELGREDLQIVAEVHYYRNRTQGQHGTESLHKDTKGKTLFVNLNFAGKHGTKIMGPQYVLNPPTTPEYESALKADMDEEVYEDLKHAKDIIDFVEIIKERELDGGGFVAFVDELIHHASPREQHRQITLGLVIQSLRKIDSGESRTSVKVVKEMVEKKGNQHKSYDQNSIKELLPSDWHDLAEEIIGVGTEKRYGSVTAMHGGKEFHLPLRDRDNKPLKRETSQRLLKSAAETSKNKHKSKKKEDSKNKHKSKKKGEGEKRTFLRTWVYLEPISSD